MSDFLKYKLSETKKLNENYSIRAFAKKAGLSSGSMSELLQGKRKLTSKMAYKIAKNLNLNPTERAQFLGEFKLLNTGTSLNEVNGLKKTSFLSRNQFQFIFESCHFSLLALVDTKDFHYDLKWIASRLKISEEKANLTINRLITAKLLKVENNKLVKEKIIFSTTDDVKDSYVQSAHLDSLKQAKNSLLEDPINLRDFTCFTLPIDLNSISEIKEKIRIFQREITLFCEEKEKNEVYTLAIQLFPRSSIAGKQNETSNEKIKDLSQGDLHEKQA